MSDLQKDQTLVDAPLIDAKKINTEKSEPMPTLAPTTDIIRPMGDTLYGTTVLDSQTFPMTYVRLDQVRLDPTRIAGDTLYQYRVDWNWIADNVTLPNLFKDNHMFVTGAFEFKILLKGSPTWWGCIVTTFNPDPHYATDSLTRQLLNDGYRKGYQTRWFNPVFQPTKGDSLVPVVVPFFLPISALRIRQFALGEYFNNYQMIDTHRFYPFGTLDIRYFTDNKVKSTETSRPTLTIYLGASVQFGGSYYTSNNSPDPL